MATAQHIAQPRIAQPRPSRQWAFVFGATIFLSAFLLFLIEFIVGKFLLPWFGGTSGVWATSMLCFQLALLAGYAYAHWVRTRVNQGGFHLALIAAVVLYAGARIAIVGALPGQHAKPAPDADPILGIITLFFTTVGLQFFLLASTAPLLQSWYAKFYLREPYILYSLSNAGSLLALVTYPLVFERELRIQTQAVLWSSLFLLYALLSGACAWRTAQLRIEPRSDSAAPVVAATRFMWLLLSACPSALFLALTNHLTQDVAPIPLLWALPLAIYLLSFIVVFGDERIYVRGVWHALFALTTFLAIAALFAGTALAVGPQLAIFCSWLFVCCMVAHGELVRLKPGEGALTSFYLTIATGGAIGGIFVALVAPVLFPGLWELHVAAIVTTLVAGAALWWHDDSWLHKPLPWLLPACIAAALFAPFVLARLHFKIPSAVLGRIAVGAATVSMLIAVWTYFARPRVRNARIWTLFNKGILAAALVGVLVPMIVNARYTGGHALYRSRNFYGALAVNAAVLPDGTRYLQLVHGRIEHGNQLTTMSAERYIPTSYFSERSGAGVILRALQKRMPSMRVGTIGLGVGTISAYARPGDLYRFYEINPTVIQIAESRPEPWFDFAPRARRLGAQVEFVLGDARLSLEHELRQSKRNDYDVFIVDAFNGDSIPVHLLTVEAMELYLRHLRDEDSVIALHISNRAVDLRRIAAGFADRLHLQALWVVSPNQDAIHHRSDWVLLSRSARFAQLPEVAAAGIGLRSAMDMTRAPGPVLWTDDFSNVWEVLDLNRDLTSSSPAQTDQRH